MVIIMKPGTKQERIQTLVTQLEQEHGVKVGITNGVGCSILGLVGDTTHIDMDKLSMNDDVERVMRVQEPYKKANRKFHPSAAGTSPSSPAPARWRAGSRLSRWPRT